MELLGFLQQKKIIRPKLTTLQDIVSLSLKRERKRLSKIINESLTQTDKTNLDNLLKEEKILSGLADLKCDTKDFKTRMISAEREKMLSIKPLYQLAKSVLSKLILSQKNIDYYADLVHYYTIYDLRKRIKSEQTYLYLLCYIWQRYRQFKDNLMEAFCFHLKQFESDLKLKAKEAHANYAIEQQSEMAVMRRFARYFVAEDVYDATPFGEVRHAAFTTIISKEELSAQVLSEEEQLKEMDFQWKIIDQNFHRYKLNLRPLMMALDFSTVLENDPWINAISWLKKKFILEESSQDNQNNDYPEKTIPKRLKKYLLKQNDTSDKQALDIDRYEFWVYRQIKRRIKSGKLHLEDSVHHRSLQQELDEAMNKGALTQALDIPALNTSIQQLLNERFAELSYQWKNFYTNFNQGKLKHLYWDEKTKTLHFKKSKDDVDEALQHRFYEECVNNFV